MKGSEENYKNGKTNNDVRQPTRLEGKEGKAKSETSFQPKI